MWIQFAFDAHRVNANSIRIQTESSAKVVRRGPPLRREEGAGERRIPQLCTWNVAVAKCYVTKIIERAAIARTGGARASHINSFVSTEMDTVPPVEVCSTKSTTNGACKDMKPM